MCPAPGAAHMEWRAGARAVAAPKVTPAGSRSCGRLWIILPPAWMKSSSAKPRGRSPIPGRHVMATWASTMAGSAPREFWSRFGRNKGRLVSKSARRRTESLLAAQYFGQCMYTSCGFFFEDLDRIEPRNDIAFARRAISLVWQATGIDLETDFLADLALPRSSRSGRTGADLYRSAAAGGERAAAGAEDRARPVRLPDGAGLPKAPHCRNANRPLRELSPPRSPATADLRSGQFLVGSHGDGKGEGASASQPAFGPDLSTVELDQMLGDGQAQAGAGGGAGLLRVSISQDSALSAGRRMSRGAIQLAVHDASASPVRLEEALEDPGQILLVDTNAGIDDMYRAGLAARASPRS